MVLNVLAVVLGLAAVCTQAGSRMWEARIDYGHARTLGDEALSYSSNTSVDATGVPDKRWVTMLPNSQHGDKVWPNRRIRYAFSSPDAKSHLSGYLSAAMEMWIAAGLPGDKFTYEELTLEQCQADRQNCLMVIEAEELSTTLALEALAFGFPSPTMKLTLSTDAGHLEIAANFAHELGHAWGLHHEHQNPEFWQETSSNPDLVVFSNSQFHCQNLKEYQSVLDQRRRTAPTPQKAEEQMEIACSAEKGRAQAIEYEFAGGINWLPLSDADRYLYLSRPIDWQSIMLYPSGAGGIVGEDGQRKPILVKKDGSLIGSNLVPSPGDVEGITVLYKYKPDSRGKLLNQIGNKFDEKFKKIRSHCK